MCHQLSGLHSWSYCPGNEGSLHPINAFEPGSGSTIMSYTKACGSQNIQFQEDPYFHLGNIIQVKTFVAQGDGNLCGESIDTDNNTPTATTDIPATGLYLPISTPFTLTGSGSDTDGDILTYCWEQYDLGDSNPLGEPDGDSPTFRSYLPVSTPDRTFPRIQTIISNIPSNKEVLPTYNRQLTFRMTVRDNHPVAGAVDWVEIKMRATTTAGPFLVTYPNELVAWKVGENQIVSWDVANTDGPLVKCKTVNIRLSLNGGQTYPVLLASGVPNTGRYCIQVPNNVTNSARIRVEAADHVFFDISNANFSIQQPATPDFSLCSGNLKEIVCLPNNYTTLVTTSAIQGFDSPITLSALGLPDGATATFSPNPVQPGSSSTMTIEFAQDQPETAFNATVQADAGITRSYDLELTIVRNDFSTFELLSPADGASGVNASPALRWNTVPDANVYEVEIATNPSFEAGVLVASAYNVAIDSFDIPNFLNQGQAYYWRARPKNECGAAEWSGPFVFMVQTQTCLTFNATDLPKNISSNGTPTIESKITVPSGGAISSVSVKKVQGYHDFFGDLEVRLVRPTGGNVLLFKSRCSSFAGNFNIAFDNLANTTFACPPPQNNAVSKPAESLTAFNGQDAAGEWILRVKDNAPSSGGQLTGFQLELCSGVSLSGPFIVNNNTLQLPSGSNAAITTGLLKTEDANNSADQLTYTLITVPAFGILQKNGGGAMKAGDQFTQTELDNGAIRYFDYGFNTSTDDFRFAVTDGEGGLASGSFTIQALVSGTKDLQQKIAFDLAPNPAEETVRISFGEALNTDTHINLFNTAGQLLRSQTLSSGNVTLVMQVSDLPQGVYTVLVSNSKATGARKLVVQ
ncbi:MAG: proprotein convertase P-domain-containing protein [Lewinellaceae bacterium]|nr:proprotein convertase P-domain-containing protein [Lewinellaceae bacterium]